MGEPYIGEIRIFAGNFAPAGWMFCEGQLLPISENETLFQLIGTTYGGDGQSTFALPDLRGRLPVHMGNGFIIGEAAGVEEVTLTTQQMTGHTHPLLCAASGGTPNSNPQGGMWAATDQTQYSTAASTVQMGNPAITTGVAGGSQPHSNFMPYLCVDFIISLFGRFPSPT
ncbi:MAG TPA: tail fiber protein [Pyrinomonadaceae bacterium]|nr:tail fiber protein [Pyrinomonadaceae bacterium]